MDAIERQNHCIDSQGLHKQKHHCSDILGEAIRLQRALRYRQAQLKELQQIHARQGGKNRETERLIEREKQLIAGDLTAFHSQVKRLSIEKTRLQNMEQGSSDSK